jgi:hypothetical protein
MTCRIRPKQQTPPPTNPQPKHESGQLKTQIHKTKSQKQEVSYGK